MNEVPAFPCCPLSQFGGTMETEQTRELERLRLRADEVLNESLGSTRRISEMCQEARQTGTAVLVTLDGQGGQFTSNHSSNFDEIVAINYTQKLTLERLDDIEAGVHKMGTDIKTAEQNLAKMKGNPIERLFHRQ